MLVYLIYVSDLDRPLKDEDASSVSARQMVENMISLVRPSDAGNLEGTKLWHLMWWRKIEDYALHVPYFSSGKGFGVNLAELLRSPHNSHLNVLARLGVPGCTLWCLVGASWLLVMRRHIFLAWPGLACRLQGVGRSDALHRLLLVGNRDRCFLDVAIEGPMIGVWFWCLFGFGVGAVMVYQAGNEQIADTPRLSLPNARRHSLGGLLPRLAER